MKAKYYIEVIEFGNIADEWEVHLRYYDEKYTPLQCCIKAVLDAKDTDKKEKLIGFDYRIRVDYEDNTYAYYHVRKVPRKNLYKAYLTETGEYILM